MEPKTGAQVSVPFDSETEARKCRTVLDIHKATSAVRS